ncbi:MAG: trypsin-like peptidase domain-containing protein [Candidatus Gastranaerophilaceae bacterium]|nr:trypsin-like peptidase domain-containing protein [Candidatus Gastranaerophilaceae bacterium]
MHAKITLISILLAFNLIFNPINCGYCGTLVPEEETNISVYEMINPAIVSIDADIEDGVSSGTGCIVTGDGYILTGSHVIEGGKTITVTTSTGQTYKAQIISAMGKNKDLAILKITPKKPLQTIKLGDSGTLKVGQKVLAIGNPFGFNGTLTQGIISRIDYKKGKIQTDAAINPGCSGGPLLNSSGEVIGINQSIYNPDNNISNIGIGFAIPINEAKKFLQLANVPNKK